MTQQTLSSTITIQEPQEQVLGILLRHLHNGIFNPGNRYSNLANINTFEGYVNGNRLRIRRITIRKELLPMADVILEPEGGITRITIQIDLKEHMRRVYWLTLACSAPVITSILIASLVSADQFGFKVFIWPIALSVLTALFLIVVRSRSLKELHRVKHAVMKATVINA